MKLNLPNRGDEMCWNVAAMLWWFGRVVDGCSTGSDQFFMAIGTDHAVRILERMLWTRTVWA